MSQPFGPGTKPGTNNNVGNRRHFPEIGPGGVCGRRLKETRKSCGQKRDGTLHLHYACTVDPDCGVKSWSLEARANHERLEHR